MAFDQGAPSFGINDAKIATWTATDTYGTLTDIMSVQMGNVTQELVSGILNGDDKITAAYAAAIGGQLQLRWGGLNLDMLAVMTGKSKTTISSVNQLQIQGGDRMPYFGVILKALSAETGDTWLFLPKVKIMSSFTLIQMEYGNFATPEVTCQIVDDETWGAINVITHPTNVDITVIPPANIAEVA